MIRFYGDVHRSFGDLEGAIAAAGDGVAAHVQVGDLGVWPLGGMPPGTHDLSPVRPLHFIDGNWDYFPWLRAHEAPVELMPNVIYVPRGTVLDMDGRRVAFLGGAKSVTRYGRTRNVNWWPGEEEVRRTDVLKFKGKQADILVSHTPPSFVTRRIFADHRSPAPATFSGHVTSLDDAVLDIWAGAEASEPNLSSRHVEEAWELLGRPTVVSGHLHRSAHLDDLGAHVLDQLEILSL